MATLYYGGGDCNVNGNVSSLVIYYRGNILIDSKLPIDYEIKLESGKLNINPSGGMQKGGPDGQTQCSDLGTVGACTGMFGQALRCHWCETQSGGTCIAPSEDCEDYQPEDLDHLGYGPDWQHPDGITPVPKKIPKPKPTGKIHNLNELFTYLGEFRVLSVTANNLEGDKEPITIKRVMDYSELLNTNAEDLTVKSEKLKVTYKHGRRYRKTRVKGGIV